MAEELKSIDLSKEDLEFYLVSKWKYALDGLYKINSSIILYCDAALQLKEKGYEAVTAIKNAGVPYAKIFEMMGYAYSEIDYSHYKRKMQEPEIDVGEIQKTAGKKTILTDMDFVTGITFHEVTKYLRNRKVKVDGAYVGLENWASRPDFCRDDKFWKSEKNGLRKLNDNPNSSYERRKVMIPENFEIFTSTEPGRMNEAIKRVLEYIKNSGKI